MGPGSAGRCPAEGAVWPSPLCRRGPEGGRASLAPRLVAGAERHSATSRALRPPRAEPARRAAHASLPSSPGGPELGEPVLGAEGTDCALEVLGGVEVAQRHEARRALDRGRPRHGPPAAPLTTAAAAKLHYVLSCNTTPGVGAAGARDRGGARQLGRRPRGHAGWHRPPELSGQPTSSRLSPTPGSLHVLFPLPRTRLPPLPCSPIARCHAHVFVLQPPPSATTSLHPAGPRPRLLPFPLLRGCRSSRQIPDSNIRSSVKPP